MSKKTIIISSSNKHKIQELSQLLANTDYNVVGLDQFPGYIPPEETGKTFLENARIKAKALHHHIQLTTHDSQLPTILADDSGIVCDDLNGAPGVHSARFAGAQAADDDNNRKLVAELKKIPAPKLTARYVCSLVYLDETGLETDVTETCAGKITFAPKGTNGFGYDPYFFLPEYGKTMAELPPEIKNTISHRGKALRCLSKILGNQQ